MPPESEVVKYKLTPKQIDAWEYLVNDNKLNLLYGGA